MLKINSILFALLCYLASTIRVSDFHSAVVTSCLRESYNRPSGIYPNVCPSGHVLIKSSCYPPCPAGYKRRNHNEDTNCYQNCPTTPEWGEGEVLCAQVNYTLGGQGYALLAGEVGDAKVI